MLIKTNILLSVIVGGYPVIDSADKYKEWEKEYLEFRDVLPFISKNNASPEELVDLNTHVRSEAVFSHCPEMCKIEGYLSCARDIIKKYYKTHSSLDEQYFEYCKELIKLAEETTGNFHYYEENQA